MPSRGVVANIMAVVLIIAGLYLIFVGPNQYTPTVIQAQGLQFSSSNLGESLVILGVLLFIAAGSIGTKTSFTPQRLKSLFLRGAILLLTLVDVGSVLVVRTENVAIVIVVSVVLVLILLGGFIIPRFLKIDSAIHRSRSH